MKQTKNTSSKKSGFYKIEDICEKMDCSKDYGYKLIRRLNKELEEQGFLTMPGKVSSAYFDKRFYQVNW